MTKVELSPPSIRYSWQPHSTVYTQHVVFFNSKKKLLKKRLLLEFSFSLRSFLLLTCFFMTQLTCKSLKCSSFFKSLLFQFNFFLMKITYNFEFLDIEPSQQVNNLFFAPANMVRHKQEKLLAHRLTVKLISDKWSRLGHWIYVMSVMSYLLYLGLLTELVITDKQRSV